MRGTPAVARPSGLYIAQCKKIFSIRDHPPTTLFISIVRTEIGKNHDMSWHSTSGPTSAKLNNRFIDLRFVFWLFLEPGTYSSNVMTKLQGSSRILFATAAYTSCNAGLSLISMAMSRLGLQNSQMNPRPSVVGNASLCFTKSHRDSLASYKRPAEPANKSGRFTQSTFTDISCTDQRLQLPRLFGWIVCQCPQPFGFPTFLCHGAIVFKSVVRTNMQCYAQC